MNIKYFQRGLSLIELLVSMVIAGIIFSGVVSVVVNSRTAFVSEQEASFIQENARYAMEVLARDIRMAGNMGCANIENARISNVVASDYDDLLSTDGVIGYEGSSGIGSEWPAAFKSKASSGSDAVILRYADPGTSASIDNHTNYTAAVLKTHTSHDWNPGDVLMIVDSSCRNIGLFRNSSSNSNNINHGTGTSNCTKVLFASTGSFDCSSTPCNPTSCGGNTPQAFSDGSSVMSFVANGYFIGESNVIPGMPALKRQVLTSSGHRAEELAQGVESMSLLYGVDTDSPKDGDIDVFLSAENVSDWSTVLAVRASLVFRSQAEVFDKNQSVTLNNQVYADRYLRQVSSATVRLRNRG